jgi:DNA-binding PadR family transcriptional regulator
VSSIRIFILGSLDERGSMHGHAIRMLAEEEHIDEWTDFGVGAIYGALKRLAAEGLIEELRLEREGNYPERAVYGITAAGSSALVELRREGLEHLAYRPDPVDLALTRLDPDRIDDLEATIEARLDRLRARLVDTEEHLPRIAQHLTLMERQVMRHKGHRLRSEIAWHEELLANLPAIIDDEKSRKGQSPA